MENYVQNISSREAKEIRQLNQREIWICIFNEHEPHHNLQCTPTYEFTFSDVRSVTQHKGIIYHPITPENAVEILIILSKAKSNEKNLIISCDAGISRSGAIAYVAHHVFGFQLKPNFWQLSEPNPYIVGLLLTEWEKQNLT